MLPLLVKYHKALPRYTSYPTAPFWQELSPLLYHERLSSLRELDTPLSLYFHIPFCKSMCLFCGCSVILNRLEEKEITYVNYLKKEIDLATSHLGKGKRVSQLHFGGGTPTKLSTQLLRDLWEKIQENFSIDSDAEIAIEIDPRTVFSEGEEKLRALKKWGFNRVSFGVQDLDPRVQEAIKRHQSAEMSKKTFFLARELGFQGINIDLIYGLPHQSSLSFQKTVEELLLWRPDRVALFSFANIPWLKPHQKSIAAESLPSLEEKFTIYAASRKAFIEAGYIAIGMDHFALPEDELAIHYKAQQLQRNFQGYTVKRAEELLSFGVTAIGYTQGGYFQNLKDLNTYYQSIDNGLLPIHRGKILSEEDSLRKWVIHTLMCQFELDKAQFQTKFSHSFDTFFSAAQKELQELEREGFLLNGKEKIVVQPLGELFIRNIASLFDGYLELSRSSTFSSSI